MDQAMVLTQLKVTLEAGGFSGLYSPGNCACELADLAPCGECRLGEGDFINGCLPGYRHLDPRPGHVEHGDFVITSHREPPDAEGFDHSYP